MSAKLAVVVGAGVAGLTAAIHLARAGMQVTVIEKNRNPGGRCDQLIEEGHTFDTGPTLLVMPLIYEQEFAAMGASCREMLDLKQVDPGYHLVFDDGSQLALGGEMGPMYRQLEAMEPGSFNALLRYLEEGGRHYQVGIEKLVNKEFRRAGDFFNLHNLPLLWQVKPLSKHYAHMGAFFKNPRLRSAFTFQDVYMGLSPFEAPATFSLMPYSELAHGVWYPKGGMSRVVTALTDLARQAGVTFILEKTVTHIDVNGWRAQGVEIEDGSHLVADIVLANADLPYVYQDLLPEDGSAAKLLKKRYSCSVISFFWGVDMVYPALQAHNLFLADDYKENFDSIIGDLGLPDNPSLYLHAPSRLDSSMAPDGQDTLTAIVPVGHISKNGGQDWGEIRDRARQQVFRRLAQLGISDLQEHIKFEVDFTPPSWKKRYNLVKGSTHGLCHNLGQLAWLRPDNRHKRYRNLYFCGASTRPGTGVPTAMISGRLAAHRILDELEG